MYDQMLLGAYETAIQANGNPERINVTLAGSAANAPASRVACRPAARVHAAAPVDHHRRPRLPGRAHLAEQRPVRARLRPELLRVGRLHVRAGRPAAGDRQHQPDQPDQPAGRRAPGLQLDDQRRHAPRSPLQPDQRRAVGGRLDLQRPDAAVRQAPQRRHPVRRQLHARQGHRQRAADHGALGAGRRRRRRPDQPRARSRSEPARHPPQFRRQRGAAADLRRRRHRGRDRESTTSSV